VRNLGKKPRGGKKGESESEDGPVQEKALKEEVVRGNLRNREKPGSVEGIT